MCYWGSLEISIHLLFLLLQLRKFGDHWHTLNILTDINIRIISLVDVSHYKSLRCTIFRYFLQYHLSSLILIAAAHDANARCKTFTDKLVEITCCQQI